MGTVQATARFYSSKVSCGSVLYKSVLGFAFACKDKQPKLKK